MLVYVISKSGKPLMPCKPARAKHLLKDDEAVVKSMEPFTIQLTIESTEEVQPVTLRVDLGANEVGMAAVSNGKVLYQGKVALWSVKRETVEAMLSTEGGQGDED